MVQCGDLRSDGEAESEVGFALPGCIGAVKTLENLRFLRIRDTGAIVTDGKAESGIGDIQCQPDASAGRRLGKGGGNQDGEQLPNTLVGAETGWNRFRRKTDIPV